MNPTKLAEFINNTWDDSIVPQLIEYIRIPNKSPLFDPKWQEHGYMEQAVTLIADWCKQNAPQNMQMEVVRLPNRTPLIFMEVPGEIDKNVLLYGHLDKQPEMTGWNEDKGPWLPVLQDGKLYGRGGADDGYAAFSALTAINALQQQGIAHPRCVIIIEADEESGSEDLPYYIDALRDRIGKPDLVVCLDSGCGNYDQLWVTTSLRGNIVGELSVSVLYEGVHSGNASGIAADSFRVARELLDRVEDQETGKIKLPECFVDIPAARVEQAQYAAEVLGEQVKQQFPFNKNVKAVAEDNTELLLNRAWRPALSITGAGGLPSLQDAGNVSRPETALKLSMRLPPTCDPERAAKAVKQALEVEPPYNAKVSFDCDDAAPGWDSPPVNAWLASTLDAASNEFFGEPAAYMGEGWTIPFMGMLGEQFPDAQFFITGVLGPKANAHGPNEFLHIEMGKRVTSCVAYVLSRIVD